MILLPLMDSPSFSTQTSQLKLLASLTNWEDGRAWTPFLFLTVTSHETDGAVADIAVGRWG